MLVELLGNNIYAHSCNCLKYKIRDQGFTRAVSFGSRTRGFCANHVVHSPSGLLPCNVDTHVLSCIITYVHPSDGGKFVD